MRSKVAFLAMLGQELFCQPKFQGRPERVPREFPGAGGVRQVHRRVSGARTRCMYALQKHSIRRWTPARVRAPTVPRDDVEFGPKWAKMGQNGLVSKSSLGSIKGVWGEQVVSKP